jgi:hypothetical protein
MRRRNTTSKQSAANMLATITKTAVRYVNPFNLNSRLARTEETSSALIWLRVKARLSAAQSGLPLKSE